MKVDIQKGKKPVTVPVAKLPKGSIGRVIVEGTDDDYLYVLRCDGGSLLRIWPSKGSIDPLGSQGEHTGWDVEIMPNGSSLKITVTE